MQPPPSPFALPPPLMSPSTFVAGRNRSFPCLSARISERKLDIAITAISARSSTSRTTEATHSKLDACQILLKGIIGMRESSISTFEYSRLTWGRVDIAEIRTKQYSDLVSQPSRSASRALSVFTLSVYVLTPPSSETTMSEDLRLAIFL
ncbi:hypothetical protein PENSPDRAFT_50924 [Peniophora sp. CONT]|nr:hypothetical protein PENSPDRAFT_50924 [Peniophora sp. CONT]